MPEAFELKEQGHVLEVTLCRGKANTITAEDSRELNRMWESFRDHEAQRFAILTGKGEKFFCAGWDLKNVAESGEESDSEYGSGGFGGLNYPRNFYKPVICAVNGIACGGGFEMMLGCDIIVAEEHATFALPEINVGVLPDCGVVKLRRRIPYHVAVELMMEPTIRLVKGKLQICQFGYECMVQNLKLKLRSGKQLCLADYMEV